MYFYPIQVAKNLYAHPHPDICGEHSASRSGHGHDCISELSAGKHSLPHNVKRSHPVAISSENIAYESSRKRSKSSDPLLSVTSTAVAVASLPRKEDGTRSILDESALALNEVSSAKDDEKQAASDAVTDEILNVGTESSDDGISSAVNSNSKIYSVESVSELLKEIIDKVDAAISEAEIAAETTDVEPEGAGIENTSTEELTEASSEQSDYAKPHVDDEVIDDYADGPQPPTLQVAECHSDSPVPSESQPVVDFIDNHGLNLLLDSIEEFASEEPHAEEMPKLEVQGGISPRTNPTDDELSIPPLSSPEGRLLDVPPPSKINPIGSGGLGLLCALAEQRFKEEIERKNPSTTSIAEIKVRPLPIVKREVSHHLTKQQQPQIGSPTCGYTSPGSCSVDNMDPMEIEMRLRMAELQRKYKEKQRELAKLQPRREKRFVISHFYIPS